MTLTQHLQCPFFCLLEPSRGGKLDRDLCSAPCAWVTQLSILTFLSCIPQQQGEEQREELLKVSRILKSEDPITTTKSTFTFSLCYFPGLCTTEASFKGILTCYPNCPCPSQASVPVSPLRPRPPCLKSDSPITVASRPNHITLPQTFPGHVNRPFTGQQRDTIPRHILRKLLACLL